MELSGAVSPRLRASGVTVVIRRQSGAAGIPFGSPIYEVLFLGLGFPLAKSGDIKAPTFHSALVRIR